MELQRSTRQVFAQDGALAQATTAYLPRSGQIDMAEAVAQAIEAQQALVVEAGTGVGKTFAYLVPALLSGQRVLVSTATKTLQDQLFARDLPHLVNALGVPVHTALLKGRGSYLCLHRLEAARHELAGDRVAARTLAKVERWAHTTHTGDLAEMDGLDERSSVIPFITSNRDNCLGSDCPQAKTCHVNAARREAMAADVVVINHHLFFADMAVRESGMAELLPSVDVVIFDEAHQLNETGIQFLGDVLSGAQLIDFAHDMLAAGLQQARGLCEWSALAGACEKAARDLRLACGKSYGAGSSFKLRWMGHTPENLDTDLWQSALQQLQTTLYAAQEALNTVTELSPDLARLYERASLLHTRAQNFLQTCPQGRVRWLDVSRDWRMVESPLNIAQTVQSKWLAGPPKTWVFTSATLGDDEALSWFTQPCGLQEATVRRVASPFDYATQAAVYVPQHLPKPNDPGHSVAVARIAADAARQLGGRTFVLTTTLRALKTIGDALSSSLEGQGVQVLVQGSAPKRRLIEQFKTAHDDSADDGSDARGAVLVASASFWEGVDMPGDALQLVIIDKLPFPPPNDPLVQARSEALEAEGGNAFNDYFVPEAAVALKQGAGRLIRRETDRGLLVIGDTRLGSMGYGRRLLRALPPMKLLKTPAEFEAQLLEINRPLAGIKSARAAIKLVAVE
jgi:ATP-dependent DNA helicase DinG